MDFQIVILAAGKGTRMGQGETPKVLVELAHKPIIFYIMDELRKSALSAKPVVVVGYKQEEVKKVLGPNYVYAYQEQQLGTGHAAASARPQVTAENIIVLYGDMPFIKAESIQKLMDLHDANNANLSMFTAIVPNFESPYESLSNYGRIIRDAAGNILKITEYKDASETEREITEVNPGIYAFKSQWLWGHVDEIKNHNAQEEYYLTDMVEIAKMSGEVIHNLPIAAEEVIGINTPEQLEQATQLILT